MNPFELIGLSFGALKERKLRSGLTILMVVIGVTLMTSLDGLGGGMTNFINEQLSTLGANVLIITPPGRGFFGPQTGRGAEIKLTSQTVRTIERIPGILYAVPYFSGVATLKSGSKEKTVTVVGLDQSKLKFIVPKVSLEAGAFVPPHDPIGVVLGHNVAYSSDLGEPFAKVGRTVYIEFSKVESKGGIEKVVVKRKSFQVKGIIEELGNLQVDNQVFVSPAAANALFEKGGFYDGIYGITRNPEENDVVEERIRKIYGENISVTSPKAIASTIKEIMGTFMGFISTIAAVSMFVGAVGIVTTLYTSVMERTREIGLLKAIGYGNATILFMFLTESLLIGAMGGLLGIASGIGGARLLIRIMPFIGEAMRITPYFQPMGLIQTFLLALALSVIAGLYPAWRASRLSPIVALRKE